MPDLIREGALAHRYRKKGDEVGGKTQRQGQKKNQRVLDEKKGGSRGESSLLKKFKSVVTKERKHLGKGRKKGPSGQKENDSIRRETPS